MQAPVFEARRVTSRAEPIQPEFNRLTGYRKLAKKPRFRPGVVGYQTESSKLVPISTLGGEDGSDGSETQTYVEFFTVKEVELQQVSRRRGVEQVPTKTIQYGVRLFAGPPGLGKDKSAAELVASKALVPVVDESETTISLNERRKGKTPLAQVAGYPPEVGKMPGTETVAPEMLLAALGLSEANEEAQQNAIKMLDARPDQKQKLAARIVRQMVDQRGGLHPLAMDNASAHADAELQKLALIAYLTEEAQRAA